MFARAMKNRQAGFTLVEIAIVMVIIGLLIGGVLKGQAMVQNAKVKRVVKQADEIRAGVMAFYDKYGVYPGDEDLAPIPPGADGEGDGDGMIEGGGTNEDNELYRDLQLAGLISGNYDGTDDLPKHAFGDDMALAWVDPGPGEAKHYFMFYNLPAEVCLEIDMKNDDGDRTTGSILASEDYTPGNTVGTFYMLF
jgi:prepilin-type N-terminal cleavage/methylation domain-containing protein